MVDLFAKASMKNAHTHPSLSFHLSWLRTYSKSSVDKIIILLDGVHESIDSAKVDTFSDSRNV